MKFVALILSSLLLFTCGCGCGCGKLNAKSSCGGKPVCAAKKDCNRCDRKKKKCQPCDVCADFRCAVNPLGDKNASAEAKIAYAKLGYRCAKARGMVPLSPRFGVPALDCPWIRSVDPEDSAVCPTSCAGCGPMVSEKPIERGYLLTAFDTPRGTRYVMIEAERDFSPAATLADVEKDFGNLVETLRGLDGKIVVYLTSFPLVTPRGNETSRVLRDLEINSFKSALQEKAGNVSFVNWQ